ncbi:S53 family peptidase [Subtercola sp. YIM 133946]|uniref:S53 family peptidase n=1 Tax=Subtercola sp. YIM 133946 TaxID=3118909 RepID=UPI002F939E94
MTDSQSPDEAEPLELVPLPGSERPAAPGGPSAGEQPVGGHPSAARSGEPVADPASVSGEATLVLRRANTLDPSAVAAAPGPLVSASSFGAEYGASDDDVALVTGTLESLGVTVLSADAASRRVRISAPVPTLDRVFGTSLQVTAGDSSARRRSGGLSIPAALDGVVTAVLGLDDRPQARAQFRVAEAHATTVSYTPVELGEIYDFPADTDGTGQTVAIIELGGGFEQSDLDTYFGGLGLAVPTVTAVGVDGADNQPGQDPQGADGEVLLDIEVVGALSPAATILVYFAPNTDAGFLDAVATAAHATPTPAAISISWGQSEDQWTAQARTAFDDALLDAAALGVTVTAAAGDNGSSDGATDGSDHADFPASSPHALACGGTRLVAVKGTVSSETVWNNGAGKGATGGGVSDVFGLPAWQRGAGVPVAGSAGGGRGVPDVAANADPQTGYEVLVDGTRAVYGGTSAVAPLWAALVARLVQSLGSGGLGLLQPALYGLTSGLRDVTVGDNGSFEAGPGWDACTGLGVPNGTALLAALREQGAGSVAGSPGAGAEPGSPVAQPADAAGAEGEVGPAVTRQAGAPGAAELADELRSIRAIGEDR